MRLALILFMTLIVRVLGRRDGCSDTLAPPFQSKNEMTPNTKPQGRLHRRTTFYLLGGYPYGWASYGMLDSDLAKVQTEYNQNVNHFQHHNHPNHPVQHGM
jgi:hypothetical protein